MGHMPVHVRYVLSTLSRFLEALSLLNVNVSQGMLEHMGGLVPFQYVPLENILVLQSIPYVNRTQVFL